MLSKYKKIIITTTLLAISTYSFADMKQCLLSAAQDNDEKTIEYCTPYLKDKNNPEATAILASIQEDNKITLNYLLWYTDLYKNISQKDNSHLYKSYTASLSTIGNIYYFGQAGKADKTKGLEYITKAANLGNDFAQKQLGGFYGSDGDTPSEDVAIAYKWFKLADINRDEETGKNSYIYTLHDFLEDKPYCIGMGEQLVAQAYLDGTAGLSKDKSKAKKYLSQAIAIYKDNEPTKASYKYCAKQKGLDLASAKKLLGSL